MLDREVLDAPWEGPPAGPEVAGYRLCRLLGRGGMGEVYLAEQEEPRRLVALKLLRGPEPSPAARQEFAREMETLGRLQHPGIPRLYAASPSGEGAGGRPYFAMEYIDGQPLTDFADGCGLAPAARLELLRQVAEVLAFAHRNGVIHRDLKPANILVEAGGQPRILDFGSAHALDGEPGPETGAPEADELVGTAGYMAPEQLAGRPGAVGPWSDVYALGVLLYELLTGRLPHQDGGPGRQPAGARISQAEIVPLAQVVPAHRGPLEVIVQRALQRNPRRRYPGVAELSEDLRRFLAGEPIRARPPGLLWRCGRFLGRHRREALAAGLALALGLGASSLWSFRPDPQQLPNTAAAPFLAGRTELLQLHGSAVDGRYGSELVSPGDLDGDGVPDLVIGSPDERLNQESRGAVRVYSGARLDGEPLYPPLYGFDANGWFGHRVVPAGDLDRDGAADFWVMDGHQTHPQQGRVTAVSGATGAILRSFTGVQAGFCARRNLCTLADRDGDGLRDLALACLVEPPPTIEVPASGKEWRELGEIVILSSASGAVLARLRPESVQAADAFPFKLLEVGDLDGDGVAELLASARRASSRGMEENGQVFLFSGADLELLHTWHGEEAGSWFGSSLAALGDLTGDGIPEVAIGATRQAARGPNTGSLAIFDGAQPARRLVRLDGDRAEARFGVSVAVVGDLTGDGLAEIAVGASSHAGATELGGAVFVFDLSQLGDGPQEPLYSSFADHGAARLGYPVRQLADFDGDGCPELGVGMAVYGRWVSFGGAVRLYSSRALRRHLAD